VLLAGNVPPRKRDRALAKASGRADLRVEDDGRPALRTRSPTSESWTGRVQRLEVAVQAVGRSVGNAARAAR
jgi:hypothetical protein